MSADTCTAKSRLALLNWFDWPSECSVHLSKQNKELAKLCAALDAIRPGQVAFHLSIRGNCQLAVHSLALIGRDKESVCSVWCQIKVIALGAVLPLRIPTRGPWRPTKTVVNAHRVAQNVCGKHLIDLN